MKGALIGFACGAVATLATVSLLYGAKGPMVSSSGNLVADGGAYYVVGKQRFDYFWRGKDAPNCWGGHTLDGRCISVVYASAYSEPDWNRVERIIDDANRPAQAKYTVTCDGRGVPHDGECRTLIGRPKGKTK